MRLAITCHFKQNDLELLRAAAVTRVVGVGGSGTDIEIRVSTFS